MIPAVAYYAGDNVCSCVIVGKFPKMVGGGGGGLISPSEDLLPIHKPRVSLTRSRNDSMNTEFQPALCSMSYRTIKPTMPEKAIL